jgi:hypothetical protein
MFRLLRLNYFEVFTMCENCGERGPDDCCVCRSMSQQAETEINSGSAKTSPILREVHSLQCGISAEDQGAKDLLTSLSKG